MIKNTQLNKEQRLVFFDNLRTLFVFGVVFQHSGMAYMWSDWWPVTDDSSIIVACMVSLFDGFLMPSLFYIAGFFAIPSIRKKTISQFLLGKTKRLLIPWLVCSLFVCPLLPLIYHYTRNGFDLTTGYWSIWQELMGNAIRFKIGILPPMDEIMQQNLFYQRYMWFIGLLFAFFAIFSMVYKMKKRWFYPAEKSIPQDRSGVWSSMKITLGIGAMTFLGSICLIGLMFYLYPHVSEPESWFTLGNLVQFRVSRIFLHTTYFILGIMTYRNRWFKTGVLPGHHMTCVGLFFFVAIGFFVSLFFLKTASGDIEKLFGLIHWFFLNLFTATALGISISASFRRLNRQTKWSKNLAANSYDLYLSHYLFVFLFQLLFVRMTQIPVLIKYGSTAILALVTASLFSRYLIRPYPKLTVASLAIAFLMMVIFIHP